MCFHFVNYGCYNFDSFEYVYDIEPTPNNAIPVRATPNNDL